jgi:hypothetical protein
VVKGFCEVIGRGMHDRGDCWVRFVYRHVPRTTDLDHEALSELTMFRYCVVTAFWLASRVSQPLYTVTP